MSYADLKSKLDAKIPREVIRKRDSGTGVKLDYLEGWYVINRLNEILGQGSWDFRVDAPIKTFEGTIEQRSGEVFTVSYIVKGTLASSGNEIIGGFEFSDYGYGDGTDKKNPGKAHELAIKEAVTDSLKRCARNLGMSMGLALYDKTQEMVDDGDTTRNDSGAKRTGLPTDTQVSSGVSEQPTAANQLNTRRVQVY